MAKSLTTRVPMFVVVAILGSDLVHNNRQTGTTVCTQRDETTLIPEPSVQFAIKDPSIRIFTVHRSAK